MSFNTITLRTGTQLPIVADRETHFRTMAALMRNMSTSTWANDTSFTLPLWPANEQAQLEPQINSLFQNWKSRTSTLHAALDCKEMKLDGAELKPT